jgi:hypothetical protein
VVRYRSAILSAVRRVQRIRSRRRGKFVKVDIIILREDAL